MSGETSPNLLKATTDKVVLIGDVGVGKTSIFTRFKSNDFDESSRGHNPKEDKFTKLWKLSGGNEVSVRTYRDVVKCIEVFVTTNTLLRGVRFLQPLQGVVHYVLS